MPHYLLRCRLFQCNFCHTVAVLQMYFQPARGISRIFAHIYVDVMLVGHVNAKIGMIDFERRAVSYGIQRQFLVVIYQKA